MKAQLETKQAMDDMMKAQAMEDIASAREARSGAVYDYAKSMVEMQKLAADPRLGLIDRYLKLIELYQAGQERLMSQQKQLPAGKG